MTVTDCKHISNIAEVRLKGQEMKKGKKERGGRGGGFVAVTEQTVEMDQRSCLGVEQ